MATWIPTTFADGPRADDYTGWHDGQCIGRVYLFWSGRWRWAAYLPDRTGRAGFADTLDEAKAECEAHW